MSPHFKVRATVDVVCGLIGAVIAIVGSRHSGSGALIAGAIFLALAALYAGYAEPSAKLVSLHPLLIMWPEIVFPPIAYLKCKGFECGSYVGIFMLAAGVTLVLVACSFSGFLVRRLLNANSPAQS